MTNDRDLSSSIQEAIARAERSHRWVSERAGIAYSTFRTRLHNEADFKVSEVARIAKVLNVSVLDLLPSYMRDGQL